MAHADSPATTAASLSPHHHDGHPAEQADHGPATRDRERRPRERGWRRDWNALSPIRAIRVAKVATTTPMPMAKAAGVVTPIVDGASSQHEQPDQTPDDGGNAANAKRHGKPLPMFRRGADAAQVQVRVERAQERDPPHRTARRVDRRGSRRARRRSARANARDRGG